MLQACGLGANGKRAASGNRSSVVNSPKDNSNVAKTNAEELGVLINLPLETEEAVWKEDSARKKVIAVLRFSPADANTIASQAEKMRAPQNIEIPSESWFPAELIAQSEMSGDGNLKGRVYAANDFFQEPYTEGRITRIESTDYFVLELSAK